MRVRVNEQFYDVTENLKLRKIGEVLEVDKDRANHLLKHGLAKVITAAEQGDYHRQTSNISIRIQTKEAVALRNAVAPNSCHPEQSEGS